MCFVEGEADVEAALRAQRGGERDDVLLTRRDRRAHRAGAVHGEDKVELLRPASSGIGLLLRRWLLDSDGRAHNHGDALRGDWRGGNALGGDWRGGCTSALAQLGTHAAALVCAPLGLMGLSSALVAEVGKWKRKLSLCISVHYLFG